ncbi:Lipoprotein-releasing system ATP-binding protein LolD [Planctomycetales bacterium 10988]|nr:Lipoprotein-releasing system ATP-binding protein LolD [Planctomycetales bacterium 10988]
MATKSISSNPPPLELMEVSKTFHQGESRVDALRGVSLKANHAEFLAIMGASGSGKSTLLHAIAGLTDIDGGQILIEGENLAKLSDAKLTKFRRNRIGLVFQAFNLIPTLTAEANVLLPAVGRAGIEARITELFDKLGLAARRKHKPDALSGGEQQRVAIARALICDPALLLLDEPTGSLDSVAGQELCRILKELSETAQRTIVVVTHEPAVAQWADRVIVLRDGKLVDDFPTADLEDARDLSQRYQTALEAPLATER